MHYPIIVVPEPEQQAYTAVAPDIGEVASFGDSIEEALANLQEAVELYLEDAEEAPQPSKLEAVLEHEEVREHGGVVAFADLDLSFLDRKPVRLNVSLPSGLVKKIDEAARKRGMTRSGYLAWAADQAMARRQAEC
ncbi:type II toxin-antitoxin system HicB family antitoxin [Oceanidesulfovibrio marinus]|uniref:Ribbon-helix-helix protein, CopG family n=1 Tax=Oceanidesulfovibrio marinus TaxID=370038 RepID=A0ABX6NKP5_9BACT|nr:type II toxin-antitoxin system HicB family antitoxin [Oceanidesulfovibrio marinus]QJT11182.1 ribbon-helix-helix protein, CopG family [Oceanidesulfovibrio marinus]